MQLPRKEMDLLRPNLVILCAGYCVIRQSPGITVAGVANALGVAHSAVDRLLPAYVAPYPMLYESASCGRLYVLANQSLQANC